VIESLGEGIRTLPPGPAATRRSKRGLRPARRLFGLTPSVSCLSLARPCADRLGIPAGSYAGRPRHHLVRNVKIQEARDDRRRPTPAPEHAPVAVLVGSSPRHRTCGPELIPILRSSYPNEGTPRVLPVVLFTNEKTRSATSRRPLLTSHARVFPRFRLFSIPHQPSWSLSRNPHQDGAHRNFTDVAWRARRTSAAAARARLHETVLRLRNSSNEARIKYTTTTRGRASPALAHAALPSYTCDRRHRSSMAR